MLVLFVVDRLDFLHFRADFGVGYYFRYELLQLIQVELWFFVHNAGIGKMDARLKSISPKLLAEIISGLFRIAVAQTVSTMGDCPRPKG